MIHAVKTIPQYFEDVINGRKPFEVRKNDRDYRECDYIALNEYDPEKPEHTPNGYTGRSALLKIRYILDNPEYCKEGYVVLGLTPCAVTVPGKIDLQKITELRITAPGVQVLYGQARGGGGA